MKGILINVEDKTVTMVDVKPGYKNIYPFIADHCTTFTCPYSYPNGDTLYCDDESLLKFGSIKGGFMYKNWQYPIVGNALILGCDNDGESTNVNSTVEYIENGLVWIDEDKAKSWANNF